MADQDGHHSEMIMQLLRHVTSSPRDPNVKGDIFRHTIYPPSLITVALYSQSYGGGGGGAESPPPPQPQKTKKARFY